MNRYIKICNSFSNYKTPKLKLREIDKRYNDLYKQYYNLNKDDIYKANFFFFFFSFSLLVVFSLFFSAFNIPIIIFYSFFISLIICYRFESIPYNKLRKIEFTLSTLIILIEMDFKLVQKTYSRRDDLCISFIKLMLSYKTPILESFQMLLMNIHLGGQPEELLSELSTPSEDFNHYLKNLLIHKFIPKKGSDTGFNLLEEKFKIHLKDLESKISVIFFIGIFFPIGICFLILFQQINNIILIILIPFFLLILNLFYKKFINIDYILLGLLNKRNTKEKALFNEYILFLRGFSLNLSRNLSPELALLRTFSQNKDQYQILTLYTSQSIKQMLNFAYSFNEFINDLKSYFKSYHFNLILDSVLRMVNESALRAGDKIRNLLSVISRHQKLEKELEIIIKGEKFKTFIFLFLLPIIIGAISGMVPFFILINRSLFKQNLAMSFKVTDIFIIFYVFEILIIFLTLLLCNTITSYYFLKVVDYEKKKGLILVTNLLFIFCFLTSFFFIWHLF